MSDEDPTVVSRRVLLQVSAVALAAGAVTVAAAQGAEAQPAATTVAAYILKQIGRASCRERV